MPFSQYWRLVDIMARMSLRADATKMLLGYVWWILEPMLYVGVLYVVFTLILTNRHPDFLMFLMTGKLAFVWFSKSVTQAGNSIVNGRGLVGKISLPMSLFPMAMVQECLYRQVAVFAFLLAVLVFNGYTPNMTWFWIVPVLIVNYIMILSLGLIAATIVTVVRDFAPLISLGMIFLMFTSGIFWNPHSIGDPAKTELLLTYNPVAFLLDAYRQALMYDTAPDMVHLATLGALFGAIICLMVILMRRGNHYLALKALTA